MDARRFFRKNNTGNEEGILFDVKGRGDNSQSATIIGKIVTTNIKKKLFKNVQDVI